jgi:hypothetical protein
MNLINIRFRSYPLSGATSVGLYVDKQIGETVGRRDGHDIPSRCFLRLSERGVKMVVTNKNAAV